MKQRALPLALAGLFSLSSSLGFGESLSQIYELALKNDATLKAAEATYRANLETEKLSRSALLPQIGATSTYRDTEFEGESFGITNFQPPQYGKVPSERDTDTLTHSVTLSQPLFDLSAWFSFRAGKATSKQARAQFAADQQDLIIRTAEAYFNALRANENLEAARAEERAAKRQLEQTQQRFDVGLIAITDVHEARAVFDNTVAQRLSFEAQLGTAFEALSVLTNQGHSSLNRLSEEFPVTQPVPADRAEWVEFAIANNHLLTAARYATQSSYQNARSKKAEHLPTLSGSYSYSTDDTEGTSKTSNPLASDIVDEHANTETIQVQLSVPLFSGGGVSASRRQAYNQYLAAEQNRIGTQRRVVQQTRSLHLTVGTDVQRIKARKQNIVSAQSALDATKAGYEVGTRNIVDVLQSQRSLYAAIRDYANARFDYVLNMLKLKQQAGNLSPQDIYNLDKWLIADKAKKQDL
ncbi:outer membrane protein [Litorivivens lipolytica]|uniref:Outer membrane protein n=1 Tax=Litorivivens lipolytica TaxID=1524264 RepID=A0A7W4W7I3_9GAMM|nr:TolC family outer membrane protein [Litorivivens lipolytica]MBB3048359.1 outer membrane protein [Litorivivens lipolytica]